MNSKHLFCFQAPIFLVYLFCTYCLSKEKEGGKWSLDMKHFFQLAGIVLVSKLFIIDHHWPSLLFLLSSIWHFPHSYPHLQPTRQPSSIPLSFIPLSTWTNPQLLGTEHLGFVCRYWSYYIDHLHTGSPPPSTAIQHCKWNGGNRFLCSTTWCLLIMYHSSNVIELFGRLHVCLCSSLL